MCRNGPICMYMYQNKDYKIERKKNVAILYFQPRINVDIHFPAASSSKLRYDPPRFAEHEQSKTLAIAFLPDHGQSIDKPRTSEINAAKLHQCPQLVDLGFD